MTCARILYYLTFLASLSSFSKWKETIVNLHPCEGAIKNEIDPIQHLA
jgi:hypothetical protein